MRECPVKCGRGPPTKHRHNDGDDRERRATTPPRVERGPLPWASSHSVVLLRGGNASRQTPLGGENFRCHDESGRAPPQARRKPVTTAIDAASAENGVPASGEEWLGRLPG